MKKLALIISVVYLLPSLSHAFLNVEALRLSKLKKEETKGTFKLGFADQNGNVDRQRYKVSSLNLYRKTRNTWIAVAEYQYGETFDVEDTREGKAHLRYTRSFSELLHSEIYTQAEFNDFRKLNSRTLFGLGPRLVKSYKKNFKFSFGVGAFYEIEKLDQEDDLENWRGNLYASLLWSGEENFAINSTIYYQPKTDDFNDYRVQLNLGLETIFAKRFFQEFTYSLSKDTRPPTRVAKSDSSILAEVGLRY